MSQVHCERFPETYAERHPSKPLTDGPYEGMMMWNTFEVDVEYVVDGGVVDEITALEPRDMPGLTHNLNAKAIYSAAMQWAKVDAERRAEEQCDD